MTEGDVDAIDRAHLDRLGARFGAAFVIQMIDLFLGDGMARVDTARGALDAGDVAAVTSAAHALKSSAGNVGASALMACAAEIERAGRGGSAPAVVAPMVADLAQRFDRTRTALLGVRAEIAP
jgi:HPt (histidine-containing phosphotransfer) domain-containing protein